MTARWSLYDFCARRFSQIIESIRELCITVANEMGRCDPKLIQPHRSVSRLLKYPLFIGMKRSRTHKDPATAKVNKHQYVGVNFSFEGVDRFREKVTCDQCIHMGADELIPRAGRKGSVLVWNRMVSLPFQNIADGCNADSYAKVVPCFAVASLRDSPAARSPFASQAVVFSSP